MNEKDIKKLFCLLGFSISMVAYPLSLSAKSESEYVKETCKGIIEYKVAKRKRVDCLTKNYAIEYDFSNKWFECYGQAKFYAYATGKKPACLLILTKPYQNNHVIEFQSMLDYYKEDLKIFTIRDY